MTSRDPLIKNFTGVSEKLNGKNYILWAQSFETIVIAHRKQAHLTDASRDDKDSTYVDWFADDAVIISWMLFSMEPAVARGVTMMQPAKKIWDALRKTYGYRKNVSKTFQVYQQIFILKQRDKTCQEHYSLLRGLIDELDIYREELAVAAYLASLNPEI